MKDHINELQLAIKLMYSDRHYTGSSPCPCCKRVAPRSGKDNPCHECKELLRFAIEAKKIGIEKMGGYVSIPLPCYGWHGHFTIPKSLQEKYGGFRTDNFPYWSSTEHPQYSSMAFLFPVREWLLSMHHAGVPCEKVMSSSSSTTTDGYATLPEEAALAFFRFMDYLSGMLKYVEASAKAEGKNLLIGLAKKEFNINEFL